MFRIAVFVLTGINWFVATNAVSQDLFLNCTLESQQSGNGILYRIRCGEVDRELLNQFRREQVSSIDLNLFDNTSYTIFFDYVVDRGGQSFTVVGHISGYTYSRVYLSLEGQHFAGYVHDVLGNRRFLVRYSPSDLKHAIIEFDHGSLVECGVEDQEQEGEGEGQMEGEGEGESEGEGEGANLFDALPLAQSIQIIDVGVFYSHQAFAGSPLQAIAAELLMGIDAANDVLKLSEVLARLRLVHYAELDYDENPSGELANISLSRFRLKSDGHMDYIEAVTFGTTQKRSLEQARDLVGADLLSGWFFKIDAGLGQVPRSILNVNECHSVLGPMGSSNNYHFQHELSHTLGVTHNCENSNPDPTIPYWFDYVYGYRWGTSFLNKRCDIMSRPASEWVKVPFYSDADRQYCEDGTCFSMGRSSEGAANSCGEPNRVGADSTDALNRTVVPVSGWKPAAQRVVIKNQHEALLAEFATTAGKGHLFCYGTLYENASTQDLSASSSTSEFLVEHLGTNLLRIDGGTGVIFIKGSVTQNATSPINPTDSHFAVSDASGDTQIIVDSDGNLILTGSVLVYDRL